MLSPEQARSNKVRAMLIDLAQAAWELVEDTDPGSEDGKVLGAALDRVADRCPD